MSSHPIVLIKQGFFQLHVDKPFRLTLIWVRSNGKLFEQFSQPLGV
jgi:hypothetical protein